MKWFVVSILAFTIAALLSLGLNGLFNMPIHINDNQINNTIEFTDIVFDQTLSNEIESEIRQLINQQQVCNTDSECLRTHYGCPFGCSSLVNAKNHQEILAFKEIWEFETNIKCKYRCSKDITKTSPACINNLCSLVETIEGKKNIRQFIENHKN